MKNNLKCKNCIWFDVCDGSDVCDHYCPGTEEGISGAVEQEYVDDLEKRHEEYQSYIDEQNS